MEIHKTNQEIFKKPKTLHMRVEKPRCSRQQKLIDMLERANM